MNHTQVDGPLAPSSLTSIRVNKMLKQFDADMRKDNATMEDAFMRIEAFVAGILVMMVQNNGLDPAGMLGMIAGTSSLMCENIGRLTTNILVKDGIIAPHEVTKFVKEQANASPYSS